MLSRRTLDVALLAFALLVPCSATLDAQTVEDGLMMSRHDLCTGFIYARDRWDEYWEGSLKRSNGNLGAVTTGSLAWMGSYGVGDRLNVIAMLPYVWTGASQGTLSGMRGVQDLTVAAKYALLDAPFTGRGSLRVIAVAAAGTPVGDYTPDFLPLSIGMASRRLSGRVTLNFQAHAGWFLHGSAAYTWRGNVTLDRNAYFTDGRLHMSNEVAMPGVFDLAVSAGYNRHGVYVPVSFSRQDTRGGGDIRRQDMPFVSNRMNASRVDAVVQYALPMRKNLAVKLGGGRAVQGRNVGQATTLSAGLLYTFHF